MINEINYDRYDHVFKIIFYMKENEDKEERKKMKIFVLLIDVGFVCILLIKSNKILPAMIQTVNRLVYANNVEVWIHMHLAVITCISLVPLPVLVY